MYCISEDYRERKETLRTRLRHSPALPKRRPHSTTPVLQVSGQEKILNKSQSILL